MQFASTAAAVLCLSAFCCTNTAADQRDSTSPGAAPGAAAVAPLFRSTEVWMLFENNNSEEVRVLHPLRFFKLQQYPLGRLILC